MTNNNDKQRLLYVDSRIPHVLLGAGFPRANMLLNVLSKMNFDISIYPLREDVLDQKYSHHIDLDKRIKFISGEQYKRTGIEDYLIRNGSEFDYIVISRPTNMVYIKPILEKIKPSLKKTRIIYDAEAIYSLREILEHKVKGVFFSKKKADENVKNEILLSNVANQIITVSKFEKQKFIDHGIKTEKINVLTHFREISQSVNCFKERDNILFVGSFLNDDAPNSDSILWFCEKILPLIQQNLKKIKLNIVGLCGSEKVSNLASDVIKIHGILENVDELYQSSKIFVAPTRYAEGLPLKVIEAAAKGIPVVTTSLIASSLGWKDRVDLLVADTPENFADKCLELYTNQKLWNRISNSAQSKVIQEYSKKKFIDSVKKIFI